MPSSPSTSLRLELMSPGDKANTWGTITNTNLGDLLEQAICGYISITLTSNATKTLTPNNYTLDEARSAILNITGAITATVSIVAPTAPKLYIVRNSTSGGQSIIIKTLSGAGVTIANGKMAIVFCNGSGFEEVIPKLADNATTCTGNSATATTLSGNSGNWFSLRTTAVANMLGWTSFGNGHVIIDASSGFDPSGAIINNVDPLSGHVWQASYPTLMGWNGSSTYGVRVDNARLADTATTATTATTAGTCTGNALTATSATHANTARYVYLASSGNYTSPENLSVSYATTAGDIPGSASLTITNLSTTGAVTSTGNITSYARVVSDLPVKIVGYASGGVTFAKIDNNGYIVRDTSDSSLKQEDLTVLLPGLAEVLQLQPKAYKWLDDIKTNGGDALTEVGFFANETTLIIPSSAPKGKDGIYGFNDRPIIAALVKAVQELSAKVTALEAK